MRRKEKERKGKERQLAISANGELQLSHVSMSDFYDLPVPIGSESHKIQSVRPGPSPSALHMHTCMRVWIHWLKRP